MVEALGIDWPVGQVAKIPSRPAEGTVVKFNEYATAVGESRYSLEGIGNVRFEAPAIEVGPNAR